MNQLVDGESRRGRDVVESGSDTVAVVEAIHPPRTPYAAKHRALLSGYEGEHAGPDGRLVPVWTPPAMPGPYTSLIPRLEAETAVSELEQALAGATYQQARAVAALILGRYTPDQRRFADIDIFVHEVTRLLAEAPADLAMKAADRLRDRKFLPNVGDVAEALAPLVNAREWALRCARAHVAEHDRRAGVKVVPAARATREGIDQLAERLAAENGVEYRPGMGVADVLRMGAAGTKDEEGE